MVIYGYVKNYRYTGDGTLYIQARIPVIHGPYYQSDYKGRRIHNYVDDKDLPYYPSLLLPHLPVDGEVCVLQSISDTSSEFIVIGLTGGSYTSGVTNLGG